MRADRSSRTAGQIGGVVLFVAQDPRLGTLVPPHLATATARLLEAAGVVSAKRRARFSRPLYRTLARASEALTTPGHFLHIALRKRYFDDAARSALAAGARQVLVVGAGLDTLALRLAPAHPEVLFVEVDHPATQGVKARALAGLGEGADNLRLVPADLARESLDAAARRAGDWRTDVRTLVVAEGVLMYLRPPAVERFLDDLARLVPAGSRFAFSFVEADAKGRPVPGLRGWLGRWMLRLAGEPLRWGVAPGSLDDLVRRHGLRLVETLEPDDLRRRYLAPQGLADEKLSRIELLAQAERI